MHTPKPFPERFPEQAMDSRPSRVERTEALPSVAPRLSFKAFVWLACLLCWPTLAQAFPDNPQHPFLATIKTHVAGIEECLIFEDNGQARHPKRYSWQAGLPHCGLSFDLGLISNGQGLFTFEPLGNDEYIISNASRGEDECLIFSDNGHASLPSRYRWGAGPYCGLAGGLAELRANGQAVWKVKKLSDGRVTITNASRGYEECLMFGHNGQDHRPTRFNWGPGDYCGYSGGESGLLSNGQAVFEVNEIRIDRTPVPAAWENGYVILQNVVATQYRLHAGHNGNGEIYLSWGSDAAFRWQIEKTGNGEFFYLINGLYPHQRLHVGHNGNGELYTGSGNDDAYQWALDQTVFGYRFRNKKYPNQFLHVAPDGSPRISAGSAKDIEDTWTVQEVATLTSPADDTFTFSSALYGHDRPVRLENVRYPDQRLHVGHNGNGQLYTGSSDDPAYRWFPTSWWTPNTVSLENRFSSPAQRLKADPSGSSQLSLGNHGATDPFQWVIEPVGQSFSITTKLAPARRLTVAADGSGQVSAQAGASGNESLWNLRVTDPPPPWPGRRDVSCPSENRKTTLKVCFFPGEYQTGEPWCQLHHDDFPNYPMELPDEVAFNAYSVRTWSCIPGQHNIPPTIFVYDEPGYKGNTEVVRGIGNLRTVGGKAHSYIVAFNDVLLDQAYVCFHKGPNGTGAKQCRPGMHVLAPAQNLSHDFNDQVKSIRFPVGGCTILTLWPHFDGEGEYHKESSDTNLDSTWANQVSSYHFWNC